MPPTPTRGLRVEVWDIRFDVWGLRFCGLGFEYVWRCRSWNLEGKVWGGGFRVWGLRFQIGVWSCFTGGSSVARVQYPGCALSKLARRPWRLGAVFPSQKRHCIGESLAFFCFANLAQVSPKASPKPPDVLPKPPKTCWKLRDWAMLVLRKKRLCIGGSLAILFF